MATPLDPIACHLIPTAVWESAPADAPLRVASLDTEGFIHLTHRLADLVDVANLLYRDEPGPHVVLMLDLERLSSTWRYDGDERYPHVYGPIDRAAIVDVRPILREPDGTFIQP